MLILEKCKKTFLGKESSYLTVKQSGKSNYCADVHLTKNSLSFEVRSSSNDSPKIKLLSTFPSLFGQIRGKSFFARGYKGSVALLDVVKHKGKYKFVNVNTGFLLAKVSPIRHNIEFEGERLPLSMDSIKGRLVIDMDLTNEVRVDEVILMSIFAFLIWLDEW